MKKIKVFLSATYVIKHNKYNMKETKERLKKDIRCKLLGDVENFIHNKNKKIYFKCNSNLQYIGGFYHEIIEVENEYLNCKKIVDIEMKQIEECDLFVCIIDNISPIATLSELLYASYLGKEIIIFADPSLCRMDKNYKFWYTISIAKKINSNIKFYNDIQEKTIIEVLKNYSLIKENSKKIQTLNSLKHKNKSRDINLFLSASYGVQHKYATKKNITTLLRNNIRTKLVGNTKKFAFENEGTYISKLHKLKYIGGFYYYFLSTENDIEIIPEYELLTNSMLEKIDNADVIVSIFDSYELAGVVSELLYATFKNKIIYIFYYDEITKFKKEYEYWYPIILSQNLNSNIKLIKVNSEKEIVKEIKNISRRKLNKWIVM